MAKIFRVLGCNFTVFLLVLGFSGVFPASAQKPAEQREQKLVIGMTQFPATMNPLIDSMVAKSYVLGMVHRQMTAYNHDWQPFCMLCTELPSFDNGRAEEITRVDGTKTIRARYTLKDGLKWGDGTPVTTKDVLFTWTVGKHPMAGASNFDLFAKDIVKITAEDEKNFIIEFDEVKCEFAAINDFRLLPAHLEGAVFEKEPAAYKDRTLYDAAPLTAGLYLGPYLIAGVEPGASFTMVKNPHWLGKQPSFDKIIIRIIENSAALGTNLLSGDIDYIAGELGLTVDEAVGLEKRLQRMKKGQYNVSYETGLTYEHIDFNLDNPHFQDIRVRRALLHGINRDAISARLFGGRQPVAHVNIHPMDVIYDKEVRKYAYDPKKAEKLLAEAGWKKAKDGLRYNDKGEKLQFQLMTTAGNRSRELVQQSIQSDWGKIGVQAVLKNETARVLFGETTRMRKFEDGVMYAWMSAPKNIPRTTLHSTMIPSAENNYAGQNYPGFKNTEADQVLDDLERVCEPDKNTALWKRIQAIYADELPALPLYYRANSYIVPKWLKGIRPTGHQDPSTLWVEEWRREP
ncbi:MAG: peptide ABC transporter substrate-binding protein [Alphaproteobacteria bacterium]|nr:MAG: peptide ABC transporter substrate-binding protein [Alphaproteobacteria bacterium]